MELKIYKLGDGRLDYTGRREPRPDDVILEGKVRQGDPIEAGRLYVYVPIFAPTPLDRDKQELQDIAEAIRELHLKAALKKAEILNKGR